MYNPSLVDQPGFLECLGPRFAVWIKVGPLSNANGTVTVPVTQPLVVKSGGVEDATVIPDGCQICQYPLSMSILKSFGIVAGPTNVVLVLPLEANLQIVVVDNGLSEFGQQIIALLC